MRQSLCLDFSIIDNFQSMQTINNKHKYKIQQLFKMLFLSLDTCLELFSPLIWALSTMVSWKSAPDLNYSRLQFRSCIGLYSAPAWCCCCHGNHVVGTQPMSSFSNAVNSQLNADASSEKLFITGLV